MAYNSSSVSVGASTKKADFDQLLANDAYILATALGGLYFKVLTIPPWDMFGDPPSVDVLKQVAHGLPTWANIIAVQALLRDDAGTYWYDVSTVSAIGGDWAPAGWCYVDATYVTVERTEEGYFDSASFNSEATDRGKILITYIA